MVLNGGEWKRYNWRDMNHREGCLFVFLVLILFSVSVSAQSADIPDRGAVQREIIDRNGDAFPTLGTIGALR